MGYSCLYLVLQNTPVCLTPLSVVPGLFLKLLVGSLLSTPPYVQLSSR